MTDIRRDLDRDYDDYLSRIDDMKIPFSHEKSDGSTVANMPLETKPRHRHSGVKVATTDSTGKWNIEAMKRLGLVKHYTIINGKEFLVVEWLELAEVEP